VRPRRYTPSDYTPLHNATDEELIAAARTLPNPSPLVTELAIRLAERLNKERYHVT
jgi:hypothetical protein